MPAGPALADNSELCASIILPFAKCSMSGSQMFNNARKCGEKRWIFRIIS